MRRQQLGFTLLELIAGLGIMLFLFASGILLYMTLIKSYYSVLALNRLDQQLRAAMNIMTLDLRRAGYSAGAVTDINSGVNTNPFMVAGSDITVVAGTCILFTYDSDSSGIMPALNNASYDKRFGYRLSGSVLQSRALTDSNFSCDSGTWVDLTDSNQVTISSLSFALTPTVVTLANNVSTVTIRNIAISLSGRLTQDATVTRTITESIRVRNDKFQP